MNLLESSWINLWLFILTSPTFLPPSHKEPFSSRDKRLGASKWDWNGTPKTDQKPRNKDFSGWHGSASTVIFRSWFYDGLIFLLCYVCCYRVVNGVVDIVLYNCIYASWTNKEIPCWADGGWRFKRVEKLNLIQLSIDVAAAVVVMIQHMFSAQSS